MKKPAWGIEEQQQTGAKKGKTPPGTGKNLKNIEKEKLGGRVFKNL